MIPALPAVKQQLTNLLSTLPEQATWDDVLYEIYVLQSIEAGLADVAAGRTIPAEEVQTYLQQRLQHSRQERARSLEQ